MILRDRDANTAWESQADQTPESRVYYCQNWRADVVALMTSAGALINQVRYDPYGVPFGIAKTDLDADGDVDNADASLFASYHGAGTMPFADWNWDGTKDLSDQSAYTADKNADSGLGRGVPAYSTWSHAGAANRKLYAGYEIDPVLTGSEGWQSSYRSGGRLWQSHLGRSTTRRGSINPASQPRSHRTAPPPPGQRDYGWFRCLESEPRKYPLNGMPSSDFDSGRSYGYLPPHLFEWGWSYSYQHDRLRVDAGSTLKWLSLSDPHLNKFFISHTAEAVQSLDVRCVKISDEEWEPQSLPQAEIHLPDVDHAARVDIWISAESHFNDAYYGKIARRTVLLGMAADFLGGFNFKWGDIGFEYDGPRYAQYAGVWQFEWCCQCCAGVDDQGVYFNRCRQAPRPLST